jgi:ABC-type glycerol-3-phosphate transport system permease component
MLPQAMPSIIALSILSFIGTWNDYMTPFLYLKNWPTLALGIYQFDTMQQYRSNVPIYYCGVLMSMVPILILFCCMQKTIMENTVAGGLKG